MEVTLVDYDSRWPALFEREQARIRDVLAARVLQLHHVGSTSVPGLCAKPVIDVLLVVAHPADEPAYVTPLEDHGYELVIREPDWHEHRVLKGPDTNVNLHVHPPTSPEIAKMVGFRDWLRTHADDRDLYASVKRHLAAKTWPSIQHYADAKTDVVEQIMRRARLIA